MNGLVEQRRCRRKFHKVAIQFLRDTEHTTLHGMVRYELYKVFRVNHDVAMLKFGDVVPMKEEKTFKLVDEDFLDSTTVGLRLQ